MARRLSRRSRGRVSVCARRDELRHYLEETRGHTALVNERLTALGYDAGTLGSLVSAVQGAIARANVRRLTPLDLVRPRQAGDRVLERARHVAAAQVSNIAVYRTLERLAAAADDHETESLAARLGEREEQTSTGSSASFRRWPTRLR